MNRRAATALRFLATVYILSTIKSLVVGVLRDSMVAELKDSSSHTDSIIARLHTINAVSTWALFGLIALMLVGFVMLVMSLERNRGLVGVAIALMIVYVGSLLYEQFYPLMSEPTTSTMALWIATSAAYSIAGMLPLIAVSREARGWDRAGIASSGAILVAALPIALDAFGMFTHTYSPAWQWAYRIFDIAYTAWFAVFALKAARVLEEGATPQAVASETALLDPGPLRAIGWAIFVRIGVGFAVGIGTIIATMHGSYDSLAGAAIGSTVISVITTLFLIGGLAGYTKYPAHQRNDGLYVVIGLLVIAVILDIVAARTTSTLYGLVDNAQHADSMWSMPSMSDMESMQTTIAWTGRLSMVLGLVSMLVMLGSLGTTARSVGALEIARTAGVTMVLTIIATFGAIFVGTWMQTVKRKDEGTLLLIAVVLLVVAVCALTNLLRVVFGVARAVEHPTTPGADPLPEARVVER